MDSKVIQKANEALSRAISETLRKTSKENEVREYVSQKVGSEVAEKLIPILAVIAENARFNKEDLMRAFAAVKIDMPNVELQIPDIKFPTEKLTINIPESKIPTINVPRPEVNITVPPIKVPEARIKIDIPDIKAPDIILPERMNVMGSVGLDGVSLRSPLPVQIRDKDGRPVNLLENLTTIIGGSSASPKIVKVSQMPYPTRQKIANITMTDANTEYSYSFPGRTKVFRMKLRAQNAQFKYAFTSGESGTNYVTVNQGGSYGESGIDLGGSTIYFQSPTASQTMEIVCYQD